MIHVLITILIVCLVVFLIEKLAVPPEPWRTIFRMIGLAIVIVALLSLIVPMPFPIWP